MGMQLRISSCINSLQNTQDSVMTTNHEKEKNEERGTLPTKITCIATWDYFNALFTNVRLPFF